MISDKVRGNQSLFGTTDKRIIKLSTCFIKFICCKRKFSCAIKLFIVEKWKRFHWEVGIGTSRYNQRRRTACWMRRCFGKQGIE